MKDDEDELTPAERRVAAKAIAAGAYLSVSKRGYHLSLSPAEIEKKRAERRALTGKYNPYVIADDASGIWLDGVKLKVIERYLDTHEGPHRTT